ncbi:MAG: PAS domain S-box protein, partial [Salinivirgaceae bacterium]|nr:PAS domain S-box protein [Salinivirgaceae bacterium]
MCQNIYDEIIINANFGYICCQIIYNHKSQPSDLEIIKSNNSFEKLFNLTNENIIGHKFSELFPDLIKNNFQWVKLYCKTAQNTENNSLNQFFDIIDTHLNVQPIIHEDDRISLIFTDIPCQNLNVEPSDSQTKYLKEIIEYSEDTILLQDEEGKILYYNNSGRYGIHTEMITGRTLFDFSDEEFASVQLSQLKSVFESGLRTYFESQGLWTGKPAHFLDQYNPIFDSDGKVVTVSVISRNITKFKLTEQALKTSEGKYRFILKNISDSISTLNSEGIQTFVSPSAEKTTGYRVAELVGKPISELVHPDDFSNIMENWQKIMDNPSETLTVKYRHKHKTKQWVYLEANAQNLLHKTKINSVLLITRDVTEREFAIQKIDEQNRLLNTLLDNLPVGVYMVDVPSGRPLISNKAALKIFGGEITKETLMKVYKTGTKLKYPIEDLPITRGKKGVKSRIDDIDIVRPDGATIQLEIYG